MPISTIRKGPNAGLPTLDKHEKSISFYEFWPVWVFYLPVVFYWLGLSIRYRGLGLPLAANPNVFLAGMIGESKIDLLNSAGEKAQKYILPFISFVASGDVQADCQRAKVRLAQSNIDYPLVAKPDEGCRGAGVQIVSSAEQLADYLNAFPVGERLMLQRLSRYKAEAGVFYVRMPDQINGKVISITLKYRATVYGDGKRCLGDLIEADERAFKLVDLYRERLGPKWQSIPKEGEEVPLVFAGSHCRGAVFKDGCEFITDALSQKIDELMKDFPEFYYGRLDIKFDDLNTFIYGEAFDVIEVNGASSEQTHIWDSKTPIKVVIKTLLQQYKTLFHIGALLRDKGVTVPSVKTLLKVWLNDIKSDQEYPKTH